MFPVSELPPPILDSPKFFPDPIYDYSAWCSYCIEWLHEMTRKGSKNVTILEALSAPGRQPFRGLGRYGTNEVLSIAGWSLFLKINSSPVNSFVLRHCRLDITVYCSARQGYVRSIMQGLFSVCFFPWSQSGVSSNFHFNTRDLTVLSPREYYRKASNASAKIDEDDDVDVDFSMNASLDPQLR